MHSSRRSFLLCLIGRAFCKRGNKGQFAPAPSWATLRQNRISMVATWARVAVSAGARTLPPVPEIRPAPTAQLMASCA